MPGPAVILRAWDGVERKNSPRASKLEQARHDRARQAKRALLPLVRDELVRKEHVS